jgi:hydroxymethylglutaryl-CoA reductase (NADPH)
MTDQATIPMKLVGPISLVSDEITAQVSVPLATFETPLWASVNRGAKVSCEVAGIQAVLLDDRMTRSIVLQANSAREIVRITQDILKRQKELADEVKKTSRFTELLDLHDQVVGNLLYLLLEFSTGDAAGHNMVTKASDAVMSWLLREYPALKYISISGNFCADKKVSAVNGILGRGKYVVAEILIPREICQKLLKTTPEAIVDLNIKKNLIGSTLAGSLRSANAHFANMLLAFYLATGQDAANIIEGSQGITFAEVKENELYFSVTLPNIIVGTVGNGKALSFVEENLKKMGCLDEALSGVNSKKLAIIAAATVLCGELSLLAAQTNPGELMRSHLLLERKRESS